MTTRNPFGSITVLALAAVLLCAPAVAEDVEKKFRIGLSIGGFNSTDEVDSDAANVLTLTDQQFVVQDRYVDPRDDSSAFGDLDINPGIITTIHAQYALTKVFIIEASVGYQKTDVGDVEVQGQYDFVDIPDVEDFSFRTFRIPVGELERIPIQVTALARFRPRASFNPYAGVGVGYTVIGLEPSAAFNELSRNMDASLGAQATVSTAFFGNPNIQKPLAADVGDLQGATLDARDTFEWHLAGGAELSIKRNWALFLDFRFTVSSRELSVGFNGGEDLGSAVPQLVDFVGSPADPATGQAYGPIDITAGGLIDAGSLQPMPDAPAGTNCGLSPGECFFDFNSKDGRLDPGFYYAQGGKVEYGGASVKIGFRYTF